MRVQLDTKGIFEIAFEKRKSNFNTQKVRLKKKYSFGKKIKKCF
jgi:hypothetical protein